MQTVTKKSAMESPPLSQTSYAEDSRYRYLEGFWVRGVSCEIIELQGYNRGSE